MNVLKQIESIVKKYPDRICYQNKEQQLTYQELWSKSSEMAAGIQKFAGGNRGPVAIFGHKQKEMIIGFLAAVKTGRAYIPLDESIPVSRVKHIVDNAKISLLVNVSPSGLPGKTVEECYGENEIQTHQTISVDDPLYIIYTSGSTGDPKGVQITDRNLCSFLAWMKSDFNLNENLTFLNQAPFSFDLSVMDMYTSLVTGGTLWAVDKDMIHRPADLFKAFKSSGVQVWVSTPSFAEYCLMSREFNENLLGQMHTFLFCGEVLQVSCAKKLKERFPNAVIYNTYGPTEATVAVTSVEITEEMIQQGDIFPVGRVKSDCKIHIDINAQEEIRGEILIEGPSVSPGYVANPKLTQDRFPEKDMYRTGDLGYVKEGLLYCVGRLDFQIKLQGYRMEIEEIEAHLSKLPGIKRAAVKPVFNQGKCEYLIGYIVGDPPGLDMHACRKGLSEMIPAYMIPRKLVEVEHLPLTANGKIDRKALGEE